MTQKKSKKVKSPKRKFTFGFSITILSIITSALLVTGLLGGAVATLIVTDILEQTPKLNIQDFVNPDSSKIYDADGNVIADIGRNLRENVTYENLPQSIIDAFVAVEDSRFFVHNGFDLPRFIKAFLTNIKSGSFSEGGSTFTMQLIKDTYYTSDTQLAPRTIDRKFQEINLALQLEKQMSKKRILEMYINNIFYGAPNSLGIQTASRYYFGKDISEINLSEAAYLAGVVNAPTRYNAYNNLEGATNRRNAVLNLMLRHGYISKLEHQIAKDIKLEDLLVGTSHEYGEAKPYQAYIDAVIKETIEITGKDPYLYPMDIYTHMNMEMQKTMDELSNDELVDFNHDLIQMAAISVDHRTGAVIGIAGGRNYTGQRVFNRALDAYHQPGSSIKPILSYALGFEYLGLATSHVVRDEPITYRGTNIIIKNFGGRYLGDMTLHTAFSLSKNIPAVKLMQEVVDTIGVARVKQYMNDMGFDNVKDRNFELGYALGGFETSVYEMSGAFTTIFNQGLQIKPHFIHRIEFKDGSEPLIPSYPSTRILSAEAAYLTTTMMEDAVSGGYANLMGILKKPYPVYAKTGTSDWGSEGLQYGIPQGVSKDVWLATGTSKYVNVVWLGFDKAEKGKQTWTTNAWNNSNVRGRIQNVILNKQAEIENNQFTALSRPAGVVDITHIVGTYPYANVIEGMNESLITRGSIKREFANLTNLQIEIPESLSKMDASVTKSGNTNKVTITLSDYPNPSDMVIAPTSLEMELKVGNKVVRDTGVRMFDPSWIYGAIQYGATVKVNNNTYAELSASNTIEVAFDGNIESNVEVCGFYAYERHIESRSNQICKTIALEDVSITVPNFESLEAFNSWASALNITNITQSKVGPQFENQIGRIQDLRMDGKVIINKTRTVKELRSGAFTLNYYDARTVDLSGLIGKPYSYLQTWEERGNFIISPSNIAVQNDWIIQEIIHRGSPIQSVTLIGRPILTIRVKAPEANP